ncbi:MAG: hypothetical protein C5B48_03205 [Candidatus Rokuibacteriota bacterium]|nr:MAG: hypothetical protein C5B48_03205 [Candidatus Rokubacteria bacterium]
MTCDQARERFGDWVDETLPHEDHAALAAHLAQCAECPRELDRFTRTIALLNALERPRAPAGFVDRVLRSARPTPWYRRLFERLFLPFRVKIPAEATAIVLIAGLALFLFERTPELQQAARPEESRGAMHGPAPPPAVPRTIAPDAVAPFSDSGRVESERRAAAAPAFEGRSQTVAPAAPKSLTLERKQEPDALPRPTAPAEDEQRAAAARAFEGRPQAVAPSAPESEALEAKSGARSRALPTISAPAPAVAPPSAALEPRAALEGSGESARRFAERIPPAADVIGRLVVKDRRAADRALTELLVRLRGAEVSRHEEPTADVLELVVPGEHYAEFTRELARIGSWLPEQALTEPAGQIRVTVRLTE